MRILLRRYGSETYVWKDATYENEHFYVKNSDGSKANVHEIAIVAVEGDENKGFVVCNNCGALIKNNPAAIAAHYEEKEAQRDCAKCEHIAYAKDKEVLGREIVENGDGTYHVKEEFNAELRCGFTYWNPVSVSSAVRNGTCKYTACRKKGVRATIDIFAKFPGVFDKAITVDALVAKKLKFDGYENGYFLYDMKSRGTIKACANEKGIVECFLVTSRGRHIHFYYSEKYDKMFFKNGTRYEEGHPYWVTEKKFEEAHQKIKELYKGAE